MTSCWIRADPKSNNWHAYQVRHTDIQTHTGRRWCEEGGREQTEVAVSPGMASATPEARKGREGFSPEP